MKTYRIRVATVLGHVGLGFAMAYEQASVMARGYWLDLRIPVQSISVVIPLFVERGSCMGGCC